jgi:hypothetical protein
VIRTDSNCFNLFSLKQELPNYKLMSVVVQMLEKEIAAADAKKRQLLATKVGPYDHNLNRFAGCAV